MSFAGFGRQTGGASAMPAARQQTTAAPRRPARWPAAGAVLAGAVALGLSGAPAALAQPVPGTSAVTPVACSVAALTAAITDAGNGSTLSLTPFCNYTLTAALPPITTAITIRGNRAAFTRSSDPGTAPFSILTVQSSGDLTLTAVTVSNGDGEGGAILNDGGGLRVAGSIFTGNSAGDAGRGGAIFNDGGILFVNASTFTGNSAGGAGQGGAIFNDGGALIVRVGEFTGNSAEEGGAIFSTGTMSDVDSTYAGNSAEADVLPADAHARQFEVPVGRGAAGAVFNAGTLTDLASTFTRNSSAGDGGAIANVNSGALTLIRALVTFNSAADMGGGLYNGASGGHSTITLIHSHVMFNSAAGGGGIFSNEGTVTLTRTTVAFNGPDNCEPLHTVPRCFS